MQTARRLVKGPHTAETSKKHLATLKYPIDLRSRIPTALSFLS